MCVVIGGLIVAAASWLALFAGAGNMGLQRSIGVGTASLLEQPAVLVAVAATGFGLSLALAAWRGLSPVSLVLAVVAWDIVATLALAPLVIGELTPLQAPLVFAAVTVLGLQPASALAGSAFGRLVARRRG